MADAKMSQLLHIDEGITCQRIGLADGARADAIPNAAGGEGGHGAATPDVATHRCSDSPAKPLSSRPIILRGKRL
jgi:hypothetical protein